MPAAALCFSLLFRSTEHVAEYTVHMHPKKKALLFPLKPVSCNCSTHPAAEFAGEYGEHATAVASW